MTAPRLHRLFVAAWPDADTRARLAELPHPDEPGIRWVPPANWHVTLRFLGTAEPDEVAERLADTTLPGATARLGPAIDRLGPQLVVPVAGVDELAAAVAAATDDLGEPARLPFRGHLTVARTKRRATSTTVGTPVAARFEVGAITLTRSELLPDGARYSTVAAFATGGGPGVSRPG